MLCDQASDTIDSNHYQPCITSHSPLLFFYNIIERLSIPRVEINPSHCPEQPWGAPPSTHTHKPCTQINPGPAGARSTPL